MGTVRRFEDLEIWKLARELENRVFEETKKGPLAMDFKLKGQMNDSSGSIMDNIAEGFGRSSRLEFIQFLSVSKGSASELQSQLYRCLDRKHITYEKFTELYGMAECLCRRISAFMNYLNKTSFKGQKFAQRQQV